MATHTTFVLVPGAWHPLSCLDPLASRLSASGYNVRGIDLASVGAEPPLDSFDPDVDLIRTAIVEEADKGQDVIVFMHSYGGMPGGQACRGLDKKGREAAGKKGGVVGLIYCTAFLVPEGKCSTRGWWAFIPRNFELIQSVLSRSQPDPSPRQPITTVDHSVG